MKDINLHFLPYLQIVSSFFNSLVWQSGEPNSYYENCYATTPDGLQDQECTESDNIICVLYGI